MNSTCVRRIELEDLSARAKEEVDIMVDMIRRNVEKARSEESKPATIAESPLDQIKKLKELLVLGALSKEEYEEKKRLLEMP